MTSHSEYNGLVKWDPSESIAGSPCDTGQARDIFCNNITHHVDSQPQPKVSYKSVTYRIPETYDTTPRFITSHTFPMIQKPGGRLCPLVLYLRGCWGDQTGTVYFTMALRPASTRPGEIRPGGSATAHVSEAVVSFASSTPAWGAPTPTTVTLDEGQARAARALINTKRDIATEYRIQVETYMVRLEVWGHASATTVHPRLWGLYAREFIGT